jgi:hypothetical protein
MKTRVVCIAVWAWAGLCVHVVPQNSNPTDQCTAARLTIFGCIKRLSLSLKVLNLRMSNLSAKPEFDFWEFVNCARCHLSFNTDLGAPQIPFWLTECGHIVCNNHLSQSRLQTRCLSSFACLHRASWFTRCRPKLCPMRGARNPVGSATAKCLQKNHINLAIFYAFKNRWTRRCLIGFVLCLTRLMVLPTPRG